MIYLLQRASGSYLDDDKNKRLEVTIDQVPELLKKYGSIVIFQDTKEIIIYDDCLE